MKKIRVPSIDEWVRRYVIGSVKSALKLSRYWKGKGLSDSEAEKRALNQAIGMIISGYGNDLEKAKNSILELRYWCDKLISEIEPDCTRCPFMPCLDFHRQDEIRKDAGGELKSFQSTINDPIGFALCHNTGGLLGSMEDVFIGTMDELPKTVIFMHMFLWHVLRDLRASAFLAFCGRYRQALSTLRSALELIFTAVYFQCLENEGLKEKFEEEWEKWWENKKILFGRGLKYAVNVGWLDQKSRKVAGKLYGNLSKAVHTMIKDEYEMIMERDKTPARPASSFYNVDFLREWFDSLFKIVIIMKEILAKLPLIHSDRSQRGSELLNNIINALKIEKKEPLPFVECPKLRGRNRF